MAKKGGNVFLWAHFIQDFFLTEYWHRQCCILHTRGKLMFLVLKALILQVSIVKTSRQQIGGKNRNLILHWKNSRVHTVHESYVERNTTGSGDFLIMFHSVYTPAPTQKNQIKQTTKQKQSNKNKQTPKKKSQRPNSKKTGKQKAQRTTELCSSTPKHPIQPALTFAHNSRPKKSERVLVQKLL